ncbi:JAB domain-containing protein [Echinicola sediminis]
MMSSWKTGIVQRCNLLNRTNRVLGIVNISTGGTSGTVADPKIIFAAALEANVISFFKRIRCFITPLFAMGLL